jgi:alpha/beta superfamily hydrolase
MAKELNEDSSFKVSIKTLIGIGFAMTTVISMWFMLQADIAEAKELPVIEIPPPDVTRMEFDMKDKNIRLTIQNTQDDVQEIKEDLRRIEEKIDKLK